MTAKEYVLHRLNGIKKVETKQDADLVDFIFKSIMSKKFRKYSTNPAANNIVRNAIELNLQANEPIKVAIPYGSYKLWRLEEESPEPDWAELFAMIYYAYWLKPITDVYKPGVWFDFCGDDAILELMNNIPEEDTLKYKNTFRSLLRFIRPYLPDNLQITFSPVGERYGSKEEFLSDLKERMRELEEKGEINITEEDKEMMRLNIKLRQGEEIDFKKNRLLHDSYMLVSKRRPYHKRSDKILISATPFGDRTSIPLGTTKSSVVKFQTGAGILRQTENDFKECILSPSQLENATFSWEEIKIDGLSGKNFNRIRVVVS